MSMIFFALPGNEQLATSLASILQAEVGEAVIRNFPDGETYVRLLSDVQHKQVVLVCTLHQPDEKLLPLYFVSSAARDLGAASVCLVAPYLAYMRQDKQFNPGEAITSRHFANLLSGTVDSLLTIDPHLHRFHHMHELYTIPATALHAAPILANWIGENIQKPLLIGPDEESMQWVKEVAELANAPYLVLHKTRLGDREVQVSQPEMHEYLSHTPVLVDDIISTAKTMIETVHHLKMLTPQPPVCIGVHAVFAPGAYEALLEAGAAQVITSNTIPHQSNQIRIDQLLAEVLQYNLTPR
ncbi:ribose-phosphate pyrophosphokinase [Pontibacter cellulosilyticus]|uniref:ribose-phosphate diphosphokinase n=1 Tax=Pontibacter cellulosilyticus TaxID=1720253 RepID=A0A923SHT7_9BACT|nr:ribose-phosphate pyrophosphokinase [Pontibacter cellulosilyticus]MBC5991897.1 ribose-phosphate pyrophosphokinase [Pontibacter cellulosilyticus]